MKITTLDKTTEDLLKTAFYHIPRFQRPYAWTLENVEEFWRDTMSLDSPRDYFIGSIVLFAEGNQKAIVDGQQRITTLLLLLCALRNVMHKEDLLDEAQGLQNLIERPDHRTNKKRFALTTETSFPYLQDRILQFASSNLKVTPKAEEDTLANAFSLLSEKIESLVEAVRNDTSISKDSVKIARIKQNLLTLRDKAFDLRLITVELDNEDDAYLIFETLNTRGKDLTQAQLVKNLFARKLKAKNAGFDPVSEKWNQLTATIEESAMGLDMDTYLVHWWNSRYDYLSKKKLHKSLKEKLATEPAKATLDDILKDAEAYRIAAEPDYREKWTTDEQSMRRALEALHVFGLMDPLVFKGSKFLRN